MLSVMDGFDDVFIVSRKIEETAALTRRSELREDVFAGERHEVVGGIELEYGAEMSEYPRRVVFELEIVFCRRR